ncbi:hypothetical protein H1C71_031489 [Ictidomys tridecemlineatus]|nr:hypothetical protein H1C71_031489 [Ictidomys tridecemlineatus]
MCVGAHIHNTLTAFPTNSFTHPHDTPMHLCVPLHTCTHPHPCLACTSEAADWRKPGEEPGEAGEEPGSRQREHVSCTSSRILQFRIVNTSLWSILTASGLQMCAFLRCVWILGSEIACWEFQWECTESAEEVYLNDIET